MDIFEAIDSRHSVRKYKPIPLSEEHKKALIEKIEEINSESGLEIQLVADEPKAFDCLIAKYGNFSGVKNYIAMVGKKSEKLDELCGYYGEKLVLFAQQMGLNTCWAKMSYRKIPGAIKIENDEELVIVISIGYGENQGKEHKSKKTDDVSKNYDESPEWFKNGIKAALKAPTAINQQKFTFGYSENKVFAKAGLGPCRNIDLGIVKYHFEIGAGKENFVWGEEK